jgi:hypothetical protein
MELKDKTEGRDVPHHLLHWQNPQAVENQPKSPPHINKPVFESTTLANQGSSKGLGLLTMSERIIGVGVSAPVRTIVTDASLQKQK